MIKKIAVLGVGNFGYAMLKHLDGKNDRAVQLHAYDVNEDLVGHLREKRKHLYLHKNVRISEAPIFHTRLRDAVVDADVIVIAVVSSAIGGVMEAIAGDVKEHVAFVNTAKALDLQSGKRISEIVGEKVKGDRYTYAVLAGGTIAADLFRSEPLGVDLACRNRAVLKRLAHVFSSRNLTVYPTTDVTGVEYASAFKNVVSVLAGIIYGLGYSYGSVTHVISRAAYEVEKIVVKELGGRKDTFSMKSQCWGNDLWMSCTGNTRNREFGVLLGKGTSLDEAYDVMKRKNKTVEGINTIRILHKVPTLKHYPLMEFLHRLINEQVGVDAINSIIFNHEF